MRSRPELATQPEEENTNSDVARLWRFFRFMGEPPKPGSPAEQRLIENCRDYTYKILDPRHTRVTGSEQEQKKLHNEIAIMTTGKRRDTMTTEEAGVIIDFACRLTTGMPLTEALKKFENHGGYI